jgi:hypothetical protein
MSSGIAFVAAMLALFALVWAEGLAGTTLEPWGDSPRAFYALVADVLLGLGTVLLALAVSVSRSQIVGWRVPKRVESVIYVASCIAIAIPLEISATNSFEASSLGEGHPLTGPCRARGNRTDHGARVADAARDPGGARCLRRSRRVPDGRSADRRSLSRFSNGWALATVEP